MPSKRSPATELRYVTASLKKAREETIHYHDEAYAQRQRAQRAEDERDEWKARFDLLLSKLGTVEVAGGADAE